MLFSVSNAAFAGTKILVFGNIFFPALPALFNSITADFKLFLMLFPAFLRAIMMRFVQYFIRDVCKNVFEQRPTVVTHHPFPFVFFPALTAAELASLMRAFETSAALLTYQIVYRWVVELVQCLTVRSPFLNAPADLVSILTSVRAAYLACT